MDKQAAGSADRGAELRMLAVLLALALAWAFQPRAAEAATGDPVLLNEFLASHTGTDTTEFVELYGTPGTPLNGLSLVAVEGDGTAAGTIDLRLDFGADARLGGNGFFLVGNQVGLSAAYGVTPDVTWATESLENGSQTLALVVTATLGAAGSVVTDTETVMDAVAVTDAGPSDSWFWSAPVLGPDDGFMPAGGHRLVDGVDSDTVADWVFADDLLGPSNTPTPATPYNAAPVADCGTDVVTEEGTAAESALAATDPDGRVMAFTASPAPATTAISVTNVSAAGPVGGTADAKLHVGAAATPGSYVVTVTATNDDAPPQTASCQLQVTVTAAPKPPEPEPAPTVSTSELWAMAGQASGAKAFLLTARLERIDRFLANGQQAAAAAQLQALANQAMGLSPRWLEADTAAALAAEADAVRASLHP